MIWPAVIVRALLCGVAFLTALSVAAARPSRAQAASDEVMRGKFVQERLLEGFQVPLRSEGSFVLQPGRGLIWHAEHPFAVLTAVTPRGLVQRSRGTETMRLPVARVPAMGRLYSLLDAALARDWAAIEEQFTVERTGDAVHWEIVLAPRASEGVDALAFKEVRLRGGRFVDAVDIVKRNGDKDRLVFSSVSLERDPLTTEEANLLDDAERP